LSAEQRRRRLGAPTKSKRDISAVISNAECALDPHNYRTEPILGEVNHVGGSESRNRFADVAFLMNTLSTLIGIAAFKRDGSSANATGDTSLRRGSGGACHTWSSLRTTGSTGNKREYLDCNSVANQTESRKPDCHRELRKMRRFARARFARDPGKKFKVWNIRSDLSHGAVAMARRDFLSCDLNSKNTKPMICFLNLFV
jgi:hypothetical protein